jgi:type I restriction enzyme S subunit
MSRLEELIAEFCPDGVEYIAIKDCIDKIQNIKWAATDGQRYQYIDLTSVDRDTHLITETQVVDKDNAPSRAQQIVNDGDILLGTTRPMLKRYCMIEEDYDNQVCSTGFCVLRAKTNVVLRRWIYHQISSTAFFEHVERFQKGASYPAISDTEVKAYTIPVPPLPVQSEIVRILDNFTELTAELTAELTTELTARKKQYEYYSNQVFLKAGENSGWKSVGDLIISLKTGLNPRQNFKLNVGGSLPYITGKDIFRNRVNITERTDKITEDALCLINKRAQLEKGDVLFASTGTGTVGRMAVIEDYQNDWGISETLYAMKTKSDMINPLYLMYALYSPSSKSQFEPKISKGSVPHLKVADLLKVSIPVPSINEQMQIVSLVKRFDTLCNDISEGIPAEIEARRNQYEYYRDKLLTFKQLS